MRNKLVRLVLSLRDLTFFFCAPRIWRIVVVLWWLRRPASPRRQRNGRRGRISWWRRPSRWTRKSWRDSRYSFIIICIQSCTSVYTTPYRWGEHNPRGSSLDYIYGLLITFKMVPSPLLCSGGCLHKEAKLEPLRQRLIFKKSVCIHQSSGLQKNWKKTF